MEIPVAMVTGPIGTLVGWVLVFGLPFLVLQLWSIMGAAAEYFLVTRPYQKSPEYATEMAAREEKARRRAVQAHRDANSAEHHLWDQHYEQLGGMWFCPDCGYPYRRHRTDCEPAGPLNRMIRKARH